jgi:hypothetical protein
VHEVGQCPEGFLDVGVGARSVDLVEVDPVGLEAAQRVLDLADDPSPGAPLLVGFLAHRHVELGGEDDVVAAAASEGFADDLLGLALGVDVSGIDEVDSGVERGVDDANRLVVVRVTPGPEHHRPEAQLGHRDARASEDAMFHPGAPC